MPICTYLNESDKDTPIVNKAVIEWLTNARKATNTHIVVHERPYEVRRWFKKLTKYSYELFWPINGIEYQCVNFYRDGTDWTINTHVTAELAVAYLMGLCSNRAD